jgi:hypothetical protein
MGIISGKLVKIKPSVIPNLKSNFRFSVLTQFIAKLVITPKSGWTDGGGLTRLYCIYRLIHGHFHDHFHIEAHIARANMGLDFISGQYGCLFSRCRKYVINCHWHQSYFGCYFLCHGCYLGGW